MDVDIKSLGTFSRLASQGADRAAYAFAQLTGTNVYADVTDVTLMAAGDLERAFDGREFVGVEVGLRGGLVGQTVMAFERDAAETLLSLLGADRTDDEFARSGVTEAGNIMTSGFIDGWADHLGIAIDMTPPTYVRASGTDILPDGAFDGDRAGVFMFESQVASSDAEVGFTIYLLPEYTGFTDLLTARRQAAGEEAGESVPVDKLPAFNQLTKRGTQSAAENITMMTGTPTDVDVSRLRFVPVEDVPSEVGDETVVGTVFELQGLPSGYLAILFDEPSAKAVAGGMIPTETDDGIGEMERGALRELGNIMTSGFIDGWANVLGTSIEHTPPQFVHDMGAAVMSPIVSQLGRTQEHAFIIDSTIRTPDEGVRCDIYALPDQRELAAALDGIDPAVADGGSLGTGTDGPS
ncbi:chemotaxis protein CheC [Candidatus Halobonum tyrrellensis]|uniref:CheA histidine kinase n=1 Tax=Candidatus Halobonum tyrrellensis G22 TaxID=1324957 RepID=V4GWI6_9EURY|nr:chemotaxis protein CheC [Candidatus Halobonum tyrrellensis]ESP89521.1 CheA histidine kinase [Candidatus Halobonum tyrrellensis G22]